MRLHDRPYVFHQLSDAWSDITRAHADDHTLGNLASSVDLGDALSDGILIGAGDLGSSLLAWACHCVV